MFKRILLTAVFLMLSSVLALSYLTVANAKGLEGQVSPDLVCMVNDTVMGKPQIPVAFEGKTYYGCCEGCVERIKTDASVRYTVDPVSGRKVDKAKAFIMAGRDGEALYFESQETAGRFTAVNGAVEKK